MKSSQKSAAPAAPAAVPEPSYDHSAISMAIRQDGFMRNYHLRPRPTIVSVTPY